MQSNLHISTLGNGLGRAGLHWGGRKLLEVMDTYTVLIIVTVSQMYTYVKNYQTVCFTYEQFIVDFSSIKLLKKKYQLERCGNQI